MMGCHGWLDPQTAGWPVWTGERMARADHVQLIRFPLVASAETRLELLDTLDTVERARADRYRFRDVSERFVVARGRLRAILGRLLDCPAAAVPLTTGPQGKPLLNRSQPRGDSDWQFNLSHSGDWGLVAVSRGRRVGVDLERIDASRNVLALANRFFAPAEAAALGALSGAEQVAAFYAVWTRKEAFLKALGDGLSFPLDEFEVSVSPAEPPQLISIRQDAAAAREWQVAAGCPTPGYWAAVTADCPTWQISVWNALPGVS